ncbi:hypothetical protein B0H16DRAFT_1484247 [Mycena metata]|uniref:Uncharacterized protein n=1 Tax=Mycena metata TaxID=1033252 RepID=A0AAD7DUD2_9AGAR|nr:hypothetical protein B0H16DRAFT_1484247 [Mycena metata]
MGADHVTANVSQHFTSAGRHRRIPEDHQSKLEFRFIFLMNVACRICYGLGYPFSAPPTPDRSPPSAPAPTGHAKEFIDGLGLTDILPKDKRFDGKAESRQIHRKVHTLAQATGRMYTKQLKDYADTTQILERVQLHFLHANLIADMTMDVTARTKNQQALIAVNTRDIGMVNDRLETLELLVMTRECLFAETMSRHKYGITQILKRHRKSIVLATLLQSTEDDINDYKRWIGALPLENTAFNASNVMDWIKLDTFNDYLTFLAERSEIPTPNLHPRPQSDIIKISDDEEPVRNRPVVDNIIEVSDSDSEGAVAPDPPCIKLEVKSEPGIVSPPLPAGQPKCRKIHISRTESVDRVVELTAISERYPISDLDTAFTLDLSHDPRSKGTTKAGKPKGLDYFLKAEDQACNGGYKCEYFDPEFLADYERTDGEDMTLTREIFARKLVQNQRDSGSAAGRTASFSRVVQRYKTRGCIKAGCSGVPVLRKRGEGPSSDGKLQFVGCSKWTKADKWKHTYAAIPADVDEPILESYMDGSGLLPADLEDHGDPDGVCAQLSHPRHAKQNQCPHVHLLDGKTVTGAMIRHPCPVTKIVYTSKDPEVQKCVVIFRGHHSHPPWPMEKPGHAAKEDVKRSVAAAAHTTKAILGTNIDVKHPAFRDTRRLRDEVSHLKTDATPITTKGSGRHSYRTEHDNIGESITDVQSGRLSSRPQPPSAPSGRAGGSRWQGREGDKIRMAPTFMLHDAAVNEPACANSIFRAKVAMILRRMRGARPDLPEHRIDKPHTSRAPRWDRRTRTHFVSGSAQEC